MLPTLTPPTSEESRRALDALPPPHNTTPPRLTAGRLYYLLRYAAPRWLKPGSDLRLQQARRRRMRRAEGRLRFPPVPPRSGPLVEVAMLTGQAYITQNLYALKSWLRHCPRPLSFIIVDDGTLDASAIARLRRAGPAVTIRTAAESERLLDAHVPASRYPILRRHRLGFVLLRKMMDAFVGATRHRIVVDTDVLLHRCPDELLRHYDAGRPVFFHDCAESYSAPRAQVEALAGLPIPPRVNAGIVAFSPGQLDWDYLETLATRMLAAFGHSFFHEQTLFAVLCGAWSAARLGEDYLVYPDDEQSRAPVHAALHYLDGSKNPRMLLSWPLLEN